MKRKLVTALCGTLALAMAVPAFAKDHKISGFYRVKFMMYDMAAGKDLDPATFIDQRFRAKWTMGLNEYVSVTYFGEIDFTYGDYSYAMPKLKYDVNNDGEDEGWKTSTRNAGGALGGDTVNLETKNLYLDVKIPDTPVSARIGLQGYADHFDFILFAADMAGVKISGKFNGVSANVGYFKWQEGVLQDDDDITLTAVQLAASPVDNLKIGADIYWLNLQDPWNGNNVALTADRRFQIDGYTPRGDVYYLGVSGSYKLPMVSLSGWFLYETGTFNSATASGDDVDLSAFAASIKAKAKLAGVNVGAQFIYASSDDDSGDTDINYIWTPAQFADAFPLGKAGLMILLPDLYTTSYPLKATTPNLAALGSVNGLAADYGLYGGYGLWGIVLTGAYTPPAMKKMYVKGAFGYLAALEDDRTPNTARSDREGKNYGTELAVRVGYKVAEFVDVSLNGAYAWLGDFFDKTVNNNDDPDGQYLTYVMVNVPF